MISLLSVLTFSSVLLLVMMSAGLVSLAGPLSRARKKRSDKKFTRDVDNGFDVLVFPRFGFMI